MQKLKYFTHANLVIENRARSRCKSVPQSNEGVTTLSYALNVAEQQIHDETQERIAELRAQMKERIRNSTEAEPINIRKLKRNSPALRASIQELVNGTRERLFKELQSDNWEQIEETRLYRISAQIDAVHDKTDKDPARLTASLMKHPKESIAWNKKILKPVSAI